MLWNKIKGVFARNEVAEAVKPEEEVATGGMPSESDTDEGLQAEAAPSSKSMLKRLFERSFGESSNASLPIRVIIGYLPEVSERDAIEYAYGIAEKHFEQLGIAYFDAFEYDGGYVFEAHEGGGGRAYLPEIIRYFDSHGAYQQGEELTVTIRTATRVVEVQRMREGLVAIVLPESAQVAQSEWLKPTTKMQPAFDKRTGLLVGGALLFVTGFIAMMTTSMLTRYQPYEAPAQAQTVAVNLQSLPIGQWSALEMVAPNSYVKAIRYRKGKWEAPEVVSESSPAPQLAPTAMPVPATEAAPASAPAAVTPAVVPPTTGETQ